MQPNTTRHKNQIFPRNQPQNGGFTVGQSVIVYIQHRTRGYTIELGKISYPLCQGGHYVKTDKGTKWVHLNCIKNPVHLRGAKRRSRSVQGSPRRSSAAASAANPPIRRRRQRRRRHRCPRTRQPICSQPPKFRVGDIVYDSEDESKNIIGKIIISYGYPDNRQYIILKENGERITLPHNKIFT